MLHQVLHQMLLQMIRRMLHRMLLRTLHRMLHAPSDAPSDAPSNVLFNTSSDAASIAALHGPSNAASISASDAMSNTQGPMDQETGRWEVNLHATDDAPEKTCAIKPDNIQPAPWPDMPVTKESKELSKAFLKVVLTIGLAPASRMSSTCALHA